MEKVIDRLKSCQVLSAGTLKLIAIVTMFVDHFAAGVYANLYVSGYLFRIGKMDNAIEIYTVCRNIGRFAFPVFCFLLVESFFYTKSRLKYLRNLVIFTIVSEVPFDLALMNGFDFEMQNVFFTLAIALLSIWGIQTVRDKVLSKPLTSFILQIVYILIGCFVATALHTDYSYYGIVLVVIFYYFRSNRLFACIMGYVWFLFEPWCFPAFVALLLYNGKRGVRLKYFFYAFYPVHLLLLYGLRILLIGR